MKKHFSTFLFLLCTLFITAQEEEDAIRKTLQNYIDGSSYNDPELIQSVFYEEADLFLSKKDQELWILSPEEYGKLFENRKKGEFNGRIGNILMIDFENNIACAKAEILIPSRDLKFIDIFLLKKIGGNWKIISKAATAISD